MTAPIQLKAGDIWELTGRRYVFQRELGNGHLLLMDEESGAPFQLEDHNGGMRLPDSAWLLEQFAMGSLKRVNGRLRSGTCRTSLELDDDLEELARLDPKARLRAFVVRGIDAMGEVPRSERALKLALTRLWDEHPEKAAELGPMPSTRSVRRWLNGRGEPGERRLKDMVASGRYGRKRRFPNLILALMQRWAVWFWTRTGWSIRDSYSRFAKVVAYINKRRLRGKRLPLLKVPTYETFRHQVRALENFETYRLKYGLKKATARFKACGKGLSADRFLRLGCMDHTVLDGFVIIDSEWMLPVGRPWLTVLMDVKTRCVVGFLLSFEPPSIYSVMECIKRANRPKLRATLLSKHYPVLVLIFGRFDEIVVDNGKEFAGTSLEDAMLDVGTTIRLAPVASPTHKAMVERFFRTLNQLLNTKLPGAVFKTDVLREMGYDPAKDAVLTIEQLENLIYEALATYHVCLHSGIGAPPAQLWQQQIDAHRIDVIDDDRRLDRMMGAVKYPCRVTRSGVALFGLQFHDEGVVSGLLEDLISFEPVRGQRRGSATVTVKVKYNPANLAEIHVWNRRRSKYVTLPCVEDRYAEGMSLWHHRRLQEWAKQKSLEFNTEAQRLEARAGLIKLIEDSAPHLKGAARNAMRRMLSPPSVERLGEGRISLGYAPARHDGLAPTNKYGLLADSRTDGGQPSTRPARPKKPKPRPRPRTQSSQKSPAKPQPQKVLSFNTDVPDWKGVEL